MKYKIIINIPNETHPTEVSITEEQMTALEPALNNKRIVNINGSYFNTTYIAKIVPDIEANALDRPKRLELEQTSQTQQTKNNRAAIDELKMEMLQKSVLRS